MIDLIDVKHIYVSCGYIDLRKGIDGYIYLADSKLSLNTFDNVIFLFCFTECGAKSSSIIYSIIETAYANQLNVQAYLTYVFKNLPIINKEQLEILLPYSKTLPKELYQ